MLPRERGDIDRVWMEYKQSGDRHLRNLLVEKYLPIVKYNAERVAAKLPDEVENDDLISAGIFGLMDAIDAFDPARGVKFETYCAPRVRGSMLDELRAMDWVPRLVRSRANRLEEVYRSLEIELGRSPTEAELASCLNLSREQLDKTLRDATAVNLVSLSRKCYESDSSRTVREIDILEDKRGSDPLRLVQHRDVRDLVTRGLSRAERLILVLYYYEQMTMKEIGLTLDLSESRVSQMHSSILNRLKVQLRYRQKELATEAP